MYIFICNPVQPGACLHACNPDDEMLMGYCPPGPRVGLQDVSQRQTSLCYVLTVTIFETGDSFTHELWQFNSWHPVDCVHHLHHLHSCMCMCICIYQDICIEALLSADQLLLNVFRKTFELSRTL